uniref:Copia protein n=1 Tax=Cajanus cajan TaxID=3821 RepID=A0A151RFH1_CAJCA|nr:Copia protein [Cajanus cajan]
MTDLKIPFPLPISTYCDNQSAIYLAHNPTFHERTKHIEVDCHVIRARIQSGLIHLLPISSASQVADTFTKSLHAHPFQNALSKLGMYDIHSPT